MQVKTNTFYVESGQTYVKNFTYQSVCFKQFPSGLCSFTITLNVFYFESYLIESLSVDPNVDAFVFLAFRNNEGGMNGIARIASTCATNPNLRSSLSEYIENDLTSAQVTTFIACGRRTKTNE